MSTSVLCVLVLQLLLLLLLQVVLLLQQAAAAAAAARAAAAAEAPAAKLCSLAVWPCVGWQPITLPGCAWLPTTSSVSRAAARC